MSIYAPPQAHGGGGECGPPLHRQLFLVLDDEIARGAIQVGDPRPARIRSRRVRGAPLRVGPGHDGRVHRLPGGPPGHLPHAGRARAAHGLRARRTRRHVCPPLRARMARAAGRHRDQRMVRCRVRRQRARVGVDRHSRRVLSTNRRRCVDTIRRSHPPGPGRTNGVGVSYRRVRVGPRTRRPARRCAKPSSRSGGRSRPRPSASESRLR
jgi:hypothetical protein